MTALFGPLWAYLVTPTLFGLAVLLIVLALRPPRRVAYGAIGFCVVCVLIGIGMLIDAKRDADKAAVYMRCYRGTPGDFDAKNKRCGGPAIGSTLFVGNEQ